MKQSQFALFLHIYPHGKIARNHSCCRHKKLNEPRLLASICSPTTDWQVCRYAPNRGISGQFESKRFTTLKSFPALPALDWWSSRQSEETLYKCSMLLFADSQNISRHFWARPPCRRTTQLLVDFQNLATFLLLLLRFIPRTVIYMRWQDFGSPGIHAESILSILDQETVLVSPDQLCSSTFSTWQQKLLLSGHFDIIHVHG